MTDFPDGTGYCDFVLKETANPLHRIYHDQEYGFPQSEDNILFERLTHEVFQAGLSWETILKKRAAFALAFDGFDVKSVANYGPEKVDALVQNQGIIRNRMKIDATIYNANQILALTESSGSFKNWIDARHPQQMDDWIKLFKAQFKFMGKEVVGTFLQSLGYLPYAHHPQCPTYSIIMAQTPAWSLEKEFFAIE